MKIAVTGPDGQLGSELVRQGATPLHGRLMSKEILDNIEAINPDVIINCAALTDVDYCERFPLLAVRTNSGGVKRLSRCFKGYFVQISTDYVFNGKNGPYEVADSPNHPINVYGWSKFDGELYAREHRTPWLIIRTTILFSSANNNFVAKIVKQLRSGDEIHLYNPGILGTPTYVPCLAAEILRIVRAGYEGVAHIAGSPWISRIEFAHQIAEAFGGNPDLIKPINLPIGESPKGAKRPQVAGLICGHSGNRPIINRVIIGHDYIDGLEELSRKKGVYT